MSVLAPKKSSTEFRRPATVQRNGKNGLAKYRSTNTDWEVRSLIGLRFNGKHSSGSCSDNKQTTTTATTTMTGANGVKGVLPVLPVLPIPNDVLSTLPVCKISNLRLTSEARPSESPPPTLATPTAMVCEPINQFQVSFVVLFADGGYSKCGLMPISPSLLIDAVPNISLLRKVDNRCLN